MIDLDKYLGRKYDLANYNCTHLVNEAWLDIFGVDLLMRTPSPFSYFKARRAVAKWERDTRDQVLEQIDSPSEICLIIVQVPNEPLPHFGLWIGGKLLHVTKPGIVVFNDVPTFPDGSTVRYFHGRPILD